ncbi:hypothetical protein K8089_00710 [Aequorivita sp. F47161]|uniref:Chain length determinant protein n=1 Tax=Aequorivita vitellina TaxID=2874475 RepID=A0A9X1QUB6_9FLAO|nr:hypothetical protein [Aequorivita vitellina]MCG2417522.1 hypothetical protein [Aequorivita vitellina]
MAKQNSSEEVDLGYLLGKFGDFSKSLARSLFLVIDFFKKYLIVIIILVIVGLAYGFYKDYTSTKSYSNELIVIPNFQSVDYLYDKVNELNLKIAAKDSAYLKTVLDTNYSKLKLIEIEPIVDLYNFISESRQYVDILKIISQNQDFSEYVENMATSKYYKYHRIRVFAKGKNTSQKIVNDLLAYFNSNEHLQEYQKIYKEVKDFEVKEHYIMIAQLDSLIKSNFDGPKAGASVSVNNIADQYNLVEKKRQLVEYLQQLEIEQNDYTVPIKLVSANFNMEPEKFINISNKVKYPLLLVFLFSLVFFVLYLFKSLKKYANAD